MITNEFAAYHEAGHAVVAKLLGADVVSLSLLPTPHCMPEVTDMEDGEVATICMAGAAATLIEYNEMGVYHTDKVAAEMYGNPQEALEAAVGLLTMNWDRVKVVVEELLGELEPCQRFDTAKICVDTVKRINENGPSVETPLI
jgi:hypothetical protein